MATAHIAKTPTAAEDARGDHLLASRRTPPLLIAATVIAVAAVAVGVYFSLFYAGVDVTQGEVQRIFYIHVSSFFGAFIAFVGTVVGGIAYLRTRKIKWDALAVAGVEVGLILALVNLVTGSIWARPIWNTWWTWDPRLTADAIMCLTYAAYLMLRQGIDNPDTRRRFSAVYGIFAFSTAIITLIIIRIRPDTIHPAVIGASPQNAEGEFGLTASMTAAFGVNMLVWSLFLPLAMMWWRMRLEALQDRAARLRARLMEG